MHLTDIQNHQIKLLTRKQIMNIFRISYPTILKWEKENNWRPFKVKNRIYYREEEIQNFINLNIESYEK